MFKIISAFALLVMLAGCGGVADNGQDTNTAGPPPLPHAMGSQTTSVTISSIGDGDVSPFVDTEYLVIGGVLSLDAVPIPGTNWIFDHWETNGVLTGPDTDPLNSVEIIPNLTVTAVFLQSVAN